MGYCDFKLTAYADYSANLGRSYDVTTSRVTGQVYTSLSLNEDLNPRNFKMRECCNCEEHPNTIPVILALDVTGSMGDACSEVAAALGEIMKNLYEKFKDVEFCIMGIGDLSYDTAPIQMSQFESDIRIAESLDKVWIEHGGGGNDFESYTAAWYMGLKRTKLDCYDKQQRKGIIITMGDEPLNPYLPKNSLNRAINDSVQQDIETDKLYEEVREKFDVFHIAVDSPNSCYHYYKDKIESTFGKILGLNLKTSTINNLSKTIEECISESVNAIPTYEVVPDTNENKVNENGEIIW